VRSAEVQRSSLLSKHISCLSNAFPKRHWPRLSKTALFWPSSGLHASFSILHATCTTCWTHLEGRDDDVLVEVGKGPPLQIHLDEVLQPLFGVG
jgi:hypothetical protein